MQWGRGRSSATGVDVGAHRAGQGAAAPQRAVYLFSMPFVLRPPGKAARGLYVPPRCPRSTDARGETGDALAASPAAGVVCGATGVGGASAMEARRDETGTA